MVNVQTETTPQVFVPPDWVNQVAQMSERFSQEIRKVDSREMVLSLAASYSVAHKLIEPYLEKYQQPKILEIGTGYGFGLCYLRKLGLNAVGVEPGNSTGFEGRYDRAIELLEANEISGARTILYPACGEALPFKDQTFDIVYSIAVLEHVENIEKCLTEALRVVRPGGVVLMLVPSYNSFHEDHYDVFWLPHLLKSKRIAKWYVRTLFKRRDWFIDELTFITPGYFKKLAKKRPQLQGMKQYLIINPTVPILRWVFGRAADIHYRLRDKRDAIGINIKDNLLLRGTGLALGVGEFLGMALQSRLVWEPSHHSDSRTFTK